MRLTKVSCCMAIIMVGLLPACKKKSGTIPIDPNVKKYFSFQPGSYWIYYDSLNVEVDSFIDVNNNLGNNNGYYIENDNIMMYKNGKWYSSLQWNLTNNLVGFIFNGDLYGYSFTYPYQQIGQIYTAGGQYEQYENINIFNSYHLNNNNFQSVLETCFTDNRSYNDTFLISTNAGLIEIYIHSSTNSRLALIRYNIIH